MTEVIPKYMPFFYYQDLLSKYDYINQWKNKIIQGNIFEVIDTFPNEFFFSTVYSPPYWNCRSYETTPIILGGNKNCDHIFVQFTRKGVSGGISHKTMLKRKGVDNFQIVADAKQGICMKCGAEKLEFGREPFVLDHTFEFEEGNPVFVQGYVSHLADLADKIMQKTRKDGSQWINLGDSYSTQGGQNTKDTEKYTDYASIKLTNRMIGTQLLKSDEFPNKTLCLIPERVAISLVDDYHYILRSLVIWKKLNAMPSSIKNKFTSNYEFWLFVVKNNKPLYWVNESSMEIVSKHPKGINGEEGYDWEWKLCEDCITKIEEKPELMESYLKSEKKKFWFVNDVETFMNAIPNLSKESLKTLEFTSVCGKKGCECGKVQRSLWRMYDYYFEQQFEDLKHPDKKGKNQFGGKKLSQNQQFTTNAQYSGKSYNALDHLYGKNMRSVWEVNVKPTKFIHYASYSEDLVHIPIDASVPKFFCTKCGLPRVKIYDFQKSDPLEIYSGSAQKEYQTAMAQNPSQAKRRILESMRKIRILKGYSHCQCEEPNYIPAFVFDPFSGCYDDQTEILTEDGFVFFKNLKREQKVATLEGGELKYVFPSKYYDYDHHKILYRVKSKSANLCITPEHNLYYKESRQSEYQLNPINTIKYRTINLIATSDWNGKYQEWFELPSIKNSSHDGGIDYSLKKIKMNDWLEFLGYFIADGWTSKSFRDKEHKYKSYSIAIAKSNHYPIVKQKMENCLKRLEFKFYHTKTGFRISNKQLFIYLIQFRKAYNKFIPKEIKQLSKDQLQILFDALISCDGYINLNDNRMSYYTVSPQLCDDMCEIVLKLGKSVTVQSRKPRIGKYIGERLIKSNNIQYQLNIRMSKTIKVDMKKDVTQIPYDGHVYCVTVSSHIIYVRRNGHCCWCGNTGTSEKEANNQHVDFIGTEIKPEYVKIAKDRLKEAMKNKTIDDFYNTVK